MLAGVSDDENSVVWIKFAEKRSHLFCAGEARLVQQVEMPTDGVGARVILSTGEETLKSCGVDSGLTKLPGCLGSWGESFDNIAAGFRAFPDRLEGRGLSCSCQSLQAVDAVRRVENFLDYSTLRVVQKSSRGGLFLRPLCSHHWLDGIPPLQNIADVGAFGSNGFGSGEATT